MHSNTSKLRLNNKSEQSRLLSSGKSSSNDGSSEHNQLLRQFWGRRDRYDWDGVCWRRVSTSQHSPGITWYRTFKKEPRETKFSNENSYIYAQRYSDIHHLFLFLTSQNIVAVFSSTGETNGRARDPHDVSSDRCCHQTHSRAQHITQVSNYQSELYSNILSMLS